MVRGLVISYSVMFLVIVAQMFRVWYTAAIHNGAIGAGSFMYRTVLNPYLWLTCTAVFFVTYRFVHN